MGDLLAAARVVLIGASTREDVFVHCMAAGKAIVATGNPGELLSDGETGLLADERDGAETVLRLLEDDDLSRRLGEAAQASVANRHDWPAMAERLEAIYRSLLARPE